MPPKFDAIIIHHHTPIFKTFFEISQKFIAFFRVRLRFFLFLNAGLDKIAKISYNI
jgi:hypothetical protein